MKYDKQFDKYISGEKSKNDLSGQVINEIKIIRPLYKNSSHTWYYECECICGKHWKTVPANIKSGHIKSCGCKKTKASKKAKEKQEHKNLINHNETLIKLNKSFTCIEFNGRKTKSIYKCAYCGKEFKMTSSNIYKERKCDCLLGTIEYDHKKIGETLRENETKIKQICEEKELEILNAYRTIKSGYKRIYLTTKCKMGHITEKDLFVLLSGRGCSKCQGINLTKEEALKDAKNILKFKNNVELIDIKKRKKEWWYNLKCTKHNIKYWQSRSNCGYYNGCPECNNHSSKGEDKIRKYLKSTNIDFIEQYKFKNCKNVNPLPFDFYVPSLNLTIEYDGEQHYKPVDFFGGEEGFLYRQQNDKIKTQYCKDNNIKLIRIPYTEFNNIENILNKELKI